MITDGEEAAEQANSMIEGRDEIRANLQEENIHKRKKAGNAKHTASS